MIKRDSNAGFAVLWEWDEHLGMRLEDKSHNESLFAVPEAFMRSFTRIDFENWYKIDFLYSMISLSIPIFIPMKKSSALFHFVHSLSHSNLVMQFE